MLPESKVETISSGASGWLGREVTRAWAVAFGVEALVSDVGPLVAQGDLRVEEGAGFPRERRALQSCPIIRAEELMSPSQQDKLPGVRICSLSP